MNNDSESLSLIIIAFVAGFIILQLRRTLGRRDGYDGKDEDKNINPFQDSHPKNASEKNTAEADNIVPIRDGIGAEAAKETPAQKSADIGVSPSSPHYSVLQQINGFDRSFTLPSFFDGAEYAYGMILNAFWSGDIQTLKQFLSKDVCEEFDNAIKAMKEEGKIFENNLADVEKIELVDASIDGSMAELTVRFNSHMTIVIKDRDGNIVDGDTENVAPIVDIWTFCRDVKRKDPNWILVSTSEA
jgi:predicted lipid-binding transport protein (Tim44 family)